MSKWFVGPAGTSDGAGTSDDPWDLEQAGEQGGYSSGSISAGDTVVLLAGTYKSGYTPGVWPSGNSDAYWMWRIGGDTTTGDIVVRPATDAHVIMDGGFWVTAPCVSFQCTDGTATFEVKCNDWYHTGGDTSPSRLFGDTSVEQAWATQGFTFHGEGGSTGSSDARGDNCRVINLVIHDVKQGIVAQQEVEGGEFYGNLIYCVGYQRPDRGHGHSMYHQNNGPDYKDVKENIFTHDFDVAFQIYGQSEGTGLNYFHVDGNVFTVADFMTGGDGAQQYFWFTDNRVYAPTNKSVHFWQGYYFPTHASATVTGNQVSHIPSSDGFGIRWGPYQSGTFVDNRMHYLGNAVVQYKRVSEGYPQTWDSNAYWAPASTSYFTVVAAGASTSQTEYSFSGWQSLTGFDANSVFSTGAPSTNEIEVRPNLYETGRANLIIHNWEGSTTVFIDLSGIGLDDGDGFSIYNAQNYFGDAPTTGIYQSLTPSQSTSIALAMGSDDWTYIRPIAAADTERAGWPLDGWGDRAKLQFPEFGAFIVRCTAPTAEGPNPNLIVQDALHAHEADNLNLSVPGPLEVQSSVHAHLAEQCNVTSTEPFPTTPYLDTFSRANEDPLSTTYGWELGYGPGLCVIDSQMSRGGAGADDWGRMYWYTAFEIDQEVYISIVTPPVGTDKFEMFARWNVSCDDGYSLSWMNNEYSIRRYDGGVATNLGSSQTLTLAGGDRLGLKLDGDTIIVFHHTFAGGGYKEHYRLVDATYQTTGVLAFGVRDTGSRFDFFSGGTIGTGDILQMQDAAHSVQSDVLDLTATTDLEIADANHLHTAGSVDFVENPIIYGDKCIHGHTADNLVLWEG